MPPPPPPPDPRSVVDLAGVDAGVLVEFHLILTDRRAVRHVCRRVYPMILLANRVGGRGGRPVQWPGAALRRLTCPAPTGITTPAGAFVCPESAFVLESELLHMITATGLELRAGARILLSPTTLRVQPGDRIGLVGRNGAGKTTTLKVLAGEGQPYAGQVEPDQRGRLPAAGPAHRRPERHRPRPGALRPRAGRAPRRDAEARGRARGERRRQAGPPLRRAGGPVRRARRVRRRGRGRPDLRQPGPARPGAGPDHRHPLRRSAPPDRAGPDPVPQLRAERQGHPAARRADQPPRPGLDHLAARLHGAAQGRARS